MFAIKNILLVLAATSLSAHASINVDDLEFECLFDENHRSGWVSHSGRLEDKNYYYTWAGIDVCATSKEDTKPCEGSVMHGNDRLYKYGELIDNGGVGEPISMSLWDDPMNQTSSSDMDIAVNPENLTGVSINLDMELTVSPLPSGHIGRQSMYAICRSLVDPYEE